MIRDILQEVHSSVELINRRHIVFPLSSTNRRKNGTAAPFSH